MRIIIVGLGVQGRKRMAVAGQEVVATVDPIVPTAQYTTVAQVSPSCYEAAFVCTPDSSKLDIARYLLSRGKHVLIEKPLLASDEDQLVELGEMARSMGVTCYTAYNHRFEPHIQRLKELLDAQILGTIYLAKFFYGNGTALDVKRSPWRDQGMGVLADLGSHLLDLTLFLFGDMDVPFELWSCNRFENRAPDHVLFGSAGRPLVELEATLLSWKNTFTVDILGELGSLHLQGLCKWGPSLLTVRKRVFPTGKPEEQVQTVQGPDPTWAAEHQYFTRLCQTKPANDLSRDHWINAVLHRLVLGIGEVLPA